MNEDVGVSDAAYLRVSRLDVSLGGRRVVENVSFSSPRGRMVALVGPNGVGKTTLLRALAGLIPATGDITLGDAPLAALDLRERGRRIAYLPQGHAIHWPLPVRDIVALGRYPHGTADPARLRPQDAEAVTRAMARADVMALADRPATEISGGERSRVALARVLAVEAPVILADEPTAFLDPRFQIEVMGLLRAAADEGALVVVVTHDLGLAARHADAVMVLCDGRLAAYAPPGEALTPDILARVFRVGVFSTAHEGKPVIVPWSAA